MSTAATPNAPVRTNGPKTDREDRLRRAAGWASIGMFLVWVGFAGLALAWNLEQRSLIQRVKTNPLSVSLDEARNLDSRIDFLNHAVWVIWAMTAAAFITWLYLEYRRVHLAHADTRFDAGWAIGAWFVPILNLWRPYQVAEDVWKATAGRRRGGALIASWWGAYLVSILVAARANSVEEAQSFDDALNTNAVFLARAGFALIAAMLALMVVRAVMRSPIGESPTGSES